MEARKCTLFFGTFLLLAQITLYTVVSGANVVSTTSIPSTPTSLAQVNSSTNATAISTTPSTLGTGSSTTPHVHMDDDDCSDEVPEPEPGTSDNRQGKQLTLEDKDKYKHENGTAEPEPEQSANEKLTGNSTTEAPAHGSATGKEAISFSFALGIAFAHFARQTQIL